MLGNYRVAAQLVASRVVLSSTVSWLVALETEIADMCSWDSRQRDLHITLVCHVP
jgi:hypothetical protein